VRLLKQDEEALKLSSGKLLQSAQCYKTADRKFVLKMLDGWFDCRTDAANVIKLFTSGSDDELSELISERVSSRLSKVSVERGSRFSSKQPSFRQPSGMFGLFLPSSTRLGRRNKFSAERFAVTNPMMEAKKPQLGPVEPIVEIGSTCAEEGELAVEDQSFQSAVQQQEHI